MRMGIGVGVLVGRHQLHQELGTQTQEVP
jgi:hypothetical protein